jgi:nucleotide-binding universal stress UspA family protein
MNERMKILIAYDGSECAQAAIDDLTEAGLPPEAEALILSVTEYWKSPETPPDDSFVALLNSYDLKRMRERSEEAFAQAGALAEEASRRVRELFPAWQVRHEARAESPAWGVIMKADEWKPDLIVLGSHGRGAVSRFVLGSVSLKVLTEAKCSVRVARKSQARVANDESPSRLLVGVDGTHGAWQAVNEVARRAWRKGSAARLVTGVEPFLYGSHFQEDIKRAEDLQRYSAHELGAAGLHISSVVREGEAKKVLVEEAESWGADAIFIGAKGHRFMERVLLGSVSYAVAARAHCSVEVVRSTKNETWEGFDVRDEG